MVETGALGGGPDPRPRATIPERMRFQAGGCAKLGSPLYADLLTRAADDFEAGGPTREVLRGHEDDPGGSALALRLMSAVHRLVLRGEAPGLAAVYADPGRDPALAWEAFASVLLDHRDRLRELVELPLQTNEVGRCAALLPGFLRVAARTGLPLRLLELGSSGGLNLRWDRCRYEARGFCWGPEGSPLKIGFELEGEPPPPVEASVVERRGCDPAPVDPTTAAGRETLLACLWADQPRRVERAEAAIALARGTPANVDRAAAAAWLGERLAEPAAGVATIVFHSIVMQYLTAEERGEIEALLREAGARASAAAPLARLRMEPAGERADIWLTTWPDGEEVRLGRAGYHGNPVELV